MTHEKRWAGIRWEELRWDEVWSVKSAVWSVGREERSVKCGVWRKQWEVRSVDCEVWSVTCGVGRVQCEVWSVECEECSVKCGVWSVKCEVWSVKTQWEVWSAKWSFKCDMCTRTPLSQNARTHGLGWRTAHASSIDEKGVIYIYIFKATSAPPRAGTTGILYYITNIWNKHILIIICIPMSIKKRLKPSPPRHRLTALLWCFFAQVTKELLRQRL